MRSTDFDNLKMKLRQAIIAKLSIITVNASLILQCLFEMGYCPDLLCLNLIGSACFILHYEYLEDAAIITCSC